MAKFGEWTPLEAELPSEGQFVIAKNKKGMVEGGCQYRAGYFEYYRQLFSDVIAWMPLPE